VEAGDDTMHVIDFLVIIAKAEALEDIGEHCMSIILMERLLSKSYVDLFYPVPALQTSQFTNRSTRYQYRATHIIKLGFRPGSRIY